jgi:Ribbon-helix-helix protein, copG family
MSTSKHPATTLRLDSKLVEELQIAILRRKERNRNQLIERLLREWLASGVGRSGESPTQGRTTAEQLRKIIATNIADHLLRNQGWITEAILDTQLYREGESVFGNRIDHFVDEKRFLAAEFTPWLVDRILSELKRGSKVFLVVDSGTTLYFFFRHLENELISRAERERGLENLVIITNNIAGVDSYMTISRLHKFQPFGVSRRVSLSDFVTCKLLTGDVFTKYAAVTGEDTDRNLDLLRRGAQSAVFIGLVVGHWIWFDHKQQRYPTPLARGRGQVSFKQALMEACDELFLLSPLGKIFLNCTIEEINAGLKNRSGGDEENKPYEPANVPGHRTTRIKLVSTTRSDNRILYTHGERVKAFCSPVVERVQDQAANTPIEDLKHLMLRFEPRVADSTQTAIDAEFPHEQTHDPEFMRKFFAVSK